MHRYQARVRGDTFSDEIIAETAAAAAMLFVQKIHDEDDVLRNDDETVIIEVNGNGGDWLSWDSYEASAVHYVKFKIKPVQYVSSY